VITDPAVCKNDPKCASDGECTLEHGMCVIGPNDCLATEGCTVEGKCTCCSGSVCVVGKDADCRRSDECKKHHRCHYNPYGGCN